MPVTPGRSKSPTGCARRSPGNTRKHAGSNPATSKSASAHAGALLEVNPTLQPLRFAVVPSEYLSGPIQCVARTDTRRLRPNPQL